eukprot:SAG31_NODE_1782_length_7281_cov_5.022139_3_plen_62_part_00
MLSLQQHQRHALCACRAGMCMCSPTHSPTHVACSIAAAGGTTAVRAAEIWPDLDAERLLVA